MRQLASNRFSLAKLARNGRKQPEDASAVLSCPSARFLGKARGNSVAPVAAQESTSSQVSLTHSRYPANTTPNDAFSESTWRGFAAQAGVVAAANTAGPVAHTSVPLQSSNTFPVVPETAFGSMPPDTASLSDSGPGRPPSIGVSGATVDPHSIPPGNPGDSKHHTASCRDPPAAEATRATTAATAATTEIYTVVATAPAAASVAAAINVGHRAYNEAKDASFSGRVVQHDGSHAVHLLVSGTTSRDYNLRMVRCHARDELRLPSTTGSVVGSGGGSLCTTAARTEDVPFGTFLYRQVRDTITATFLPAGYPDTTGQNYVRFMTWQGVNNMAMTANTVLASTFMLYAVGLGAGSIPTAGALNWVLKDGMGQLGTLLFGKTIAHNFDVHSKTWFFLSAVMLQAAAALELLTVLVPEHFLLMGSLANTLKGLAWMAAGSTRSVFHLSFARDNNIADVTAKGTSQYIFASLVGTAGGAVMCAAVGQSGAAAACCFGLLAAATIGSAYMAVQVIPLSTLNATRLQLLVDAFLASISPPDVHDRLRRHHHGRQTYVGNEIRDDGGDVDGAAYRGAAGAAAEADDINDGARGSGSGGVSSRAAGGFGGRDRDRDHGSAMRRCPRPRAYRTVDRCYIGPSTHEYEMMYDDSMDPQVPTPLELSPLDPPLPYFSRAAYRLSPDIMVGSRLEHIVDGNANLLVMLLTTYKYAHFMVVPRREALHVVLHERADPRDMVQAYLQACILRRRLRSDQPLPDPDEQIPELRLELQESLAAAERLTTIFMSTIEANGWTVAKVVVEAQRRRARW
ncbi:hypothetical protein VaNZ11_001407 [Volvox africanus]|uniref:Uncharacterized protein n=1 Tax=Volvox africanus TaxID=51714 RepID=A0ABQ5RPR7_9CHLO|nr:hypothetical protein VaNZ11_001407 [Volvox africanus]